MRRDSWQVKAAMQQRAQGMLDAVQIDISTGWEKPSYVNKAHFLVYKTTRKVFVSLDSPHE